MELILLLAIALVIVFVVLGHQQQQKRKEAMAAWAKVRGLRFDPARDRHMDERYPYFSCLRRGGNRYAYNVITGSVNGRRVCAFDYHYETHSTDSQGRSQTDHHWFSAVIVDACLPLKPLVIREEHFMDKVGEFLGFDDIDFESIEFSRRFYVKSPDRQWAFDVLQQSTMEFLLAMPQFALEFQGSHVVAYRDHTFSTQDFEVALNVIDGVLQRLPEYLLREMRGDRGL